MTVLTPRHRRKRLGRHHYLPAMADGQGDGIQLAIVGSWHGLSANGYAAHTLDAARHAGLQVATYIALNSMAGADSVARGLKACWDYSDLCFVALDVEIKGVTVDIISDAVSAVSAAKLIPIIYTGGWFWYGKFGDPHDFSHLPLWTSRYDGYADLTVNWKPYGGWEAPAAKQYEGTNHTLGFGNDLSVFDMTALGGPS